MHLLCIIFSLARQIDWIFIPNYAIHLADKTVTPGSTREDCLSTCEADPDYVSIDYLKATNTCNHNIELGLVPAPDVAYDYYYSICDDRCTFPGESLIVSLVTENCHHTASSSWNAATFDWQNQGRSVGQYQLMWAWVINYTYLLFIVLTTYLIPTIHVDCPKLNGILGSVTSKTNTGLLPVFWCYSLSMSVR